MTWVNIGAIFLVIVVGSFIAGFIEAWLEQRKHEKEKGSKLWLKKGSN